MIKNIITGVIAVILAVVASLALVGNNQPNNLNNLNSLGGTTNYDVLDVSDGYQIDGTDVINGNGGLSISATSTVSKSFDGHVAYGGFTVATGTAAAVYTNNTGTAMMCDADSGFIEAIGTTFAPLLRVAIGTSTSATGYSTNLLASTTLATTTNNVLSLTYAVPFKLANTESIVAALSNIAGDVASSTYYSNWDMEFGFHCWLMGQ